MTDAIGSNANTASTLLSSERGGGGGGAAIVQPTSTPVPPSSATGEDAQRAIIEQLRKELKEQSASKNAELVELRTRTAQLDEHNAAMVHTAQPQIHEVIDMFTSQAVNAEAQARLGSLKEWATGLSSIPSNQLESEMPLVVFAAAASSKNKRVRELEEKVEAQSKALAQAHQDKEATDGKLEKTARQLSDMEELAVDRQRANTELSKRIERGIAQHTRNDFSLQSSREKSAGARRAQEVLEGQHTQGTQGAPVDTPRANGKAPLHVGGCAAEAAMGGGGGNLETTTAVASMGGTRRATQNPFESDYQSVADFVRSNGIGSGRLYQSGSSHAMIGSSGNAMSATGSSSGSATVEEIAAHLRAST
jgi:hypothetical protein